LKNEEDRCHRYRGIVVFPHWGIHPLHYKIPWRQKTETHQTHAACRHHFGSIHLSHGQIVGNGWYDRTDAEVKFWKQSNKLVQQEKIWDRAKKADPAFTVSNMFWWYNMYSTADYSATPRPNYLADGRKIPDCYTYPAGLRDELQKQLGQFPLFKFWGPGADISSTKWIADASIITDKKYDPTLTLIYLPHLDYCLQKFGPGLPSISSFLLEVDKVVEDLVTYYESKTAGIILLSEYGIGPVNTPIHLNRYLRKKGMLAIRVERGLELLDAGASKAFAVADHQVAHIYLNEPSLEEEVQLFLRTIPGVALVLNKEEQQTYHINHERSGDFVLMAENNSWFTYYFWEDDALAPDYARAVDATLIKGSHGSIAVAQDYHPVLITNGNGGKDNIEATEVYSIIWELLNS